MAQAVDRSPVYAPPRSAPRDAPFEEFLASGAGRATAAAGLRHFLEVAEAWRITRALDEARGNRSAAARALGIGRRTLYTKLAKLGLG